MPMTLRAYRVNKGETRLQASKGLGVSKDTLGNWEKGKTFPSVKNIEKICQYYGVSYDDIIFLPNKTLKAL